jgi:hypothetical protein
VDSSIGEEERKEKSLVAGIEADSGLAACLSEFGTDWEMPVPRIDETRVT